MEDIYTRHTHKGYGLVGNGNGAGRARKEAGWTLPRPDMVVADACWRAPAAVRDYDVQERGVLADTGRNTMEDYTVVTMGCHTCLALRAGIAFGFLFLVLWHLEHLHPAVGFLCVWVRSCRM